jgi:sulfite reductase beta subunit-like hemoprotein
MVRGSGLRMPLQITSEIPLIMPAEETLTQVERDKLDIDPNFDFRALAVQDYDDIPANVMAMFKWCGVYTQLQKGFFMIRLVTPGGIMTTRQFARAVDLAEQYAQGELCITTRQTLQFHWVRLPDIHKIIEGMADVGVTTRNGCGDVTRNTVTCSMQGVCPHEAGDQVRDFILAVATDPEIRDRQRNLPRKHKISVAGCNRACAQTLVNCQGWVPASKPASAGETESGWRFHAGGGLGARPYNAKVIFDWVPHDLAIHVARATVEAFRRHGDRRKRAWARLKVVVDRMGPAAFGDLLIEIMRERGIEGLDRIEPATDSTPRIAPAFLDGQAVVPQRQPGLSTVRVLIPRSEITTDMGRHICRLADAYGQGEIMFTNRQNIDIRNVPDEQTDSLIAELDRAGLQTDANERLPDIVCCVGTTQCKLAVSDTRKTCLDILDKLGTDKAFWKRIGSLKINMNGCPNNCGHAWIGDIGLRGRRRRGNEGHNIEGYTVFVGGSTADAGRFGEPLLEADSAAIVPTLRELLEIYLRDRQDDTETFAAYVKRVGVDAIRQSMLSATETD